MKVLCLGKIRLRKNSVTLLFTITVQMHIMSYGQNCYSGLITQICLIRFKTSEISNLVRKNKCRKFVQQNYEVII